jgi:diphosphomevalonate decarboxylase
VTVVAIAHPNIALAKYWGKRPGAGNIPAVPSLSVTLAGLTTRTEVDLLPGTAEDRLTINGRTISCEPGGKTGNVFQELRELAKSEARFDVRSTNDFPTASGLASSASGFAALVVGCAAALGLDASTEQLALVGMRGSASAARSFFPDFAELVPGEDAVRVGPVPVAPGVDLRVVVAVTDEGPKALSSSEGMKLVARTSMFHEAWLAGAPRIYTAVREALGVGDFERLGPLVEESALAMHASCIAAGVVYFQPATLAAYATVRRLRDQGISAWATMDAGPHVKVVTRAGDVVAVVAALEATPGVLRTLVAAPGPGARVEA